jgi:pyruvate, water dikinase
MVYAQAGSRKATRNVATSKLERQRFCIDDTEVLELADYAIKIEDHYSAVAGHAMPMDIEWAKDSEDGCLYIVQARPETVASQRAASFEIFTLKGRAPVLVSGRAVGEKIAAGCIRVIRDVGDLKKFQAERCWWRLQPAPIGNRSCELRLRSSPIMAGGRAMLR